jgi:hypothetical protein
VLAAAGLERPFRRRWENAGGVARWSLAVSPAVVALGAGLLLRELVWAGWEAPVDWVARHSATSARLDPSATTGDLRLLDLSALLRWTGALLGASLVAAWYGTPGRRPVIVTSLRQRALHTAVGVAAMAAVLGAGELLIRRAGAIAELPRFAVVLWVIGVVVPWIAARLDAVGSSFHR